MVWSGCAALQHQNNFDVCWCKGSVAERIFKPLIERIEAAGGQILGSQLVQSIDMESSYGDVASVTARRALCLLEQHCVLHFGSMMLTLHWTQCPLIA